jgi:AraC-like DNA-binding protein
MVVRRIFRIKPSYPANLWKNLKIGTYDASGFGLGKACKWLFDKKKIWLNGLRARKGLSHSPRLQRAADWNGTRCGRFVALGIWPAANSVCPASRHGLVLTIQPAERLDVRYAGLTVKRPPVAGSINVIPAGSSVQWSRKGSMDALFIHLEPSLIARVAIESFDFDSSRTVLPPLYGLSVPELRSAMLAVDAFRSGFANQSHFCFHFKRIAGVTPRQFRGSERICDSGQMMRTLTSISVDEDISR